MWGVRVVVPHKLRNQILHELHEDHIGIVKMKGLARNYVWWPGIDQDVESLANKCQGCQKVQFEAPTVPLHPWEWPIKPWQRIHVDYSAPFMGHMFLIVVDAHSKWPEVLLTGSTSSERTVELLREVFARYGLPEHLHSDNGRQFTSEVFQNFMKANNIKHTFSAPYHPATNGQAERSKRRPGCCVTTSCKVSACLQECNIRHHWGVSGYATARPRTKDSSRRSPTRYQENSWKTSSQLSWTKRRQRQIVFSWREGSCKKLSRWPMVDSWHHPIEERDESVNGMRAYAVQVGDTVWRSHGDQIRASDMAPAPAPDIATSEQIVHEPWETERDVSENVHMGTPSIVMDQPVKRSPQMVTPHKVVAETVRRSKRLFKPPDNLTL